VRSPERRIPVEDQEIRTGEEEDVELHKRKVMKASEDAPAATGESEEDDVELHARKSAKKL
jgi:hypothetical protein